MTLERLENRSLLSASPAIAAFMITPTVANDTGLALTQAPPIGTITSNPTPTFNVTAPETSVVNVYADLDGSGTIVPADLVGTTTIAGSDSTLNATQTFSLTTALNDATLFPPSATNGLPNGTRHLIAQATDSTGTNVGDPVDLTFFLDTTNPVITGVTYTSNGAPVYSSSSAAVVPQTITGITIDFQDPTNRDSQQFAASQALNYVIANVVSNYSLVGTNAGSIAISAVNVSNTTTLGGPGQSEVQLTFAQSLPNDTYNLKVSQNLVNDANNALFGSTFATPGGAQTVNFPTGYNADQTPETAPADFNAAGLTFTAISGTGVGVASPQSIQVSNLQDISGTATTLVNFGRASDVVFAGNFPDFASGTSADGFSKLALYGKDPFTGMLGWQFQSSNGQVSSWVDNPDNVSGLPVAGNFGNLSNGDGLGIFTGKTWYLYSLNLDGNTPSISRIQTVSWPTQGSPVVGNFEGTSGVVDLATYNITTGQFTIASSTDNFTTYSTIQLARVPGVRTRPVAADIEGNGMTDLGLWVPDIGGSPSLTKPGDWYFLETGGQSLLNNPAITVAHYQFGSSLGVPFTGLFSAGMSGTATFPSVSTSASPMTVSVNKATVTAAVATTAKTVVAATPAITAKSVVAAAAATTQTVAPAKTTAKPAAKPAVQTLASTIQTFSGTTGNDVFQLSPGKLPNTWNLSINGVLRDSSVQLTSLKLDGLGGKNSLVITGTGHGDDAELWSNKALFRSGNLTVTAANFSNITVNGGGTDTVTLHDAAGANSLVENGGTVTLSGNGYTETARGFASYMAIATAGSNDTADLYASTASPVVSNKGGVVLLDNSGTKVGTTYFNSVRVHAKSGAVAKTFTYSKSAAVVAKPKALSTVNLASAVPLATAKSKLAAGKSAAAVLAASSSKTASQMTVKTTNAVDAVFAAFYR